MYFLNYNLFSCYLNIFTFIISDLMKEILINLDLYFESYEYSNF